MPNRLLLTLSRNRRMADLALTSPASRPLVFRFVAGEDLSSAVDVVQRLNGRGIAASLDHLGENTRDRAGAGAAMQDYIEALEAVAARGLDANISVKLSSLGLDLGDAVTADNLRGVLGVAREHGAFVRVDMESSLYTGRTLDLVDQMRHEGYENVGPVIQSYLYRSRDDLDRLVAEGVRVRLCKGAYDEEPNAAFRRKRDTDRTYLLLMERLLERGTYPAIATHDEAIIAHALLFARRREIGPERFEFQMLYGVRRDLQESLVAEGYKVRVYVPYGAQWYPYLVRRMAERPANLAFVLGSLLDERSKRPE